MPLQHGDATHAGLAVWLAAADAQFGERMYRLSGMIRGGRGGAEGSNVKGAESKKEQLELTLSLARCMCVCANVSASGRISINMYPELPSEQ